MAAHHHHHAHDADASRPGQQKRLAAALCLAVLYMAAEVVGGLLSNSLALLADAGHMLSDAAALGLGLFAVWVAGKPVSSQRTFGHHRAEILVALLNAATLLAVSAGVVFEAWRRFGEPQEVAAGAMLGIAVGGLAVNGVMLLILHGGRDESLNLRGAWLHVLSDALGSVGVIIAAVCLRVWQLPWVDPLASLVICVLISHSAWSLMKEAVAVLMENAPASISVEAVRESLMASAGVRDVHCLHVWTIASGLNSLSAHVVVDRDRMDPAQLRTLRKLLEQRFPVGHISLQLEPDDFGPCSDALPDSCLARGREAECEGEHAH